MSKPLSELINTVEGLLRQRADDRKGVDSAQSALRRTETALANAQNELGKGLEQAGLVGSDFRLVNKQTATKGTLHQVFGIVHEDS
jgi:hypothetical protein